MTDPAVEAAKRALVSWGHKLTNGTEGAMALTGAREALAPIRELHRLDKELSCGDGCCDTCECGHPWPCSTAALIYSKKELTND